MPKVQACSSKKAAGLTLSFIERPASNAVGHSVSLNLIYAHGDGEALIVDEASVDGKDGHEQHNVSACNKQQQ